MSFFKLREEHRLSVLKRIFGLKGYEITGGWRKLHNEALHNLYCSPSIIRIIKSRRMKWAYSTHREKAVYTGYWWENEGNRTTRKTKK
jgi:hypothetical protein